MDAFCDPCPSARSPDGPFLVPCPRRLADAGRAGPAGRTGRARGDLPRGIVAGQAGVRDRRLLPHGRGRVAGGLARRHPGGVHRPPLRPAEGRGLARDLDRAPRRLGPPADDHRPPPGRLPRLPAGRGAPAVHLRPGGGHDPALRHAGRRRRGAQADRLRPRPRGPAGLARRQVDRGERRRLPRVRRRRRVQRQAAQGDRRRQAPGPRGRRPALPPLDLLARRHLHPRPAGRRGERQGGQGPDPGPLGQPDVLPRRRPGLRFRGRLLVAGLRLEPRGAIRSPRPTPTSGGCRSTARSPRPRP